MFKTALPDWSMFLKSDLSVTFNTLKIPQLLSLWLLSFLPSPLPGSWALSPSSWHWCALPWVLYYASSITSLLLTLNSFRTMVFIPSAGLSNFIWLSHRNPSPTQSSTHHRHLLTLSACVSKEGHLSGQPHLRTLLLPAGLPSVSSIPPLPGTARFHHDRHHNKLSEWNPLSLTFLLLKGTQ